MNPDTRKLLVENGAEALYNYAWAQGKGGIVNSTWATALESEREPYRERSAQMLAAFLAVESLVPCPKCGGEGRNRAICACSDPAYCRRGNPCPVCKGKRVVPSGPAIVELLIEMGVLYSYGDFREGGWDGEVEAAEELDDPNSFALYRVYRLRAPVPEAKEQ